MRRFFPCRPWPLLLIVALLGLSLPVHAAPSSSPVMDTGEEDAAQDQTDPVANLMATLTPEEKIGQLFMTTFEGTSAGADTDIGKLISEHHIGGVILSSVNRNFINKSDTPTQIASLTNELQAKAIASNSGIPLFIALDHEGDGYPYTRVTGGMTSLPNAMAIGATWSPENARLVGEITGRELAAIGVNLLLGPDVDVLYNPQPSGRGDIGTRTFGGDPWWVAQMGRAYICGVHQGGSGRVATVAKHFPGHGGSDRLPDQEIATVDKSLTELKRIELPPFFAVTGAQSEDDCAVTDAMMTSHIRYRGLQGNIRQFTAPISFDAEGLASILGLSEFSGWRSRGLIVSDALGVPAVAKYFDPTERTFPHRQVAKEALMAGNDLLSIDQFARPQASVTQSANLADTVAYFREEYDSNPQFHQRVEDAVAHILQLKLRIYGDKLDTATAAVKPEEAVKTAGQGTKAISQMARSAVTLLYPPAGSGAASGTGTLPPAPRRDEDILIFTDAERVKDCRDAACEWYEAMPVNAVQDAILSIYGPGGTGQIDPGRVHSVPFNDLKAYMSRLMEGGQPATPTATPTGTPTPDIAALLDNAKWIIFAMRNVDRDADSDAVRVFLDNGNGGLSDKRLVVLAFNAPYYLDTTEINKLTLYLAVYSKTTPFVEAAVRALFGEYQPRGHSPVNVEGINYDLLRELAPDPARPFVLTQMEPAPDAALQAPTVVRLQAGPLMDRNGNLVPDGTEVTFDASYEASNQFMPSVKGMTTNGLVAATITLRQPGSVVISARAGDAAQSSTLRLAIAAPPTPTPLPSLTPSDTPPPTVAPTGTPAPAATLAPTPPQTPTPTPPAPPSESHDGGGSLLERAWVLALALAGTAVAGLGGMLWLKRRAAPRNNRLRWALLCVSGGMAGYIVYILLLPAAWRMPALAAATAFAGALAALPMLGLAHRTPRP